MTLGQIYIRQFTQHNHLSAILDHAPQPGLLDAELLLELAEWMLPSLVADVSPGCLDQILQMVR